MHQRQARPEDSLQQKFLLYFPEKGRPQNIHLGQSLQIGVGKSASLRPLIITSITKTTKISQSPQPLSGRPLLPVPIWNSKAKSPQVSPPQLPPRLVFLPMRLRTPSLLKFALFSAKGVYKVPSLSHQGEYDPVPLMALIRLHFRGRRQVGVHLLVFQFLDYDVAEFLVFDCVLRRKFPENLAGQHSAGLVKMAPVFRGGKGTFEMMRTRSNNSNFLSQSPSPRLMDNPGAKRIAILGKNQKPLRFHLGKQSFKIDSNNVRFQLVEHISAVDHIDLLDLRGKFCQRLVLDNFRISSQKFSYFPHLACRFNTVYRPSISKMLYEGSRTSGQPRPEINET